jgi:hypothetical protein
MPPLRDRSCASHRVVDGRSLTWGRAGSWLVGATSLGLTLFTATQALGRERPRVALVTSQPSGTTATRLEAELRHLGIQVILVPVDRRARVERRILERVARSERAFAAVWMVSGADKTEIWIADRVRGKMLPREVVAEENDPDSRDDTIAVGTVEVLRASLLAVTVEPKPRDDALSSAPEVKRLIRRRRKPGTAPTWSLGVAVGPAVDFGVGGVGPSWGPELGIRWQSAGVWGIEALSSVTLRPATVSGIARYQAEQPPGEIVSTPTADVFLYRGGLAITWSPFEGPWVPLVAVGATLVRFEAKGRVAATGIDGVRDGTWAPGPYLGFGLGYQLFESLRVRTDLGLMVARRCTLRFVGSEVVRWGEPAVNATVSLELMIPGPEG